MTDQDKFNHALNTADTILINGPKFRAMVNALMQAAPTMMHGHVLAVNAALATASPLMEKTEEVKAE